MQSLRSPALRAAAPFTRNLALLLLLLLGALTPQPGQAQVITIQLLVDRLSAFLCRTEPTNLVLYPISAPDITSNAPVLLPPVDSEVCALWANSFASKGVLLQSPNLHFKVLGSIQLNIQIFLGTITKNDMISPSFVAKIKAEAERRISDNLLLLTTPRLKIVLQKTAEEAAAGKLVLSVEKLTYIMLDVEWMFLSNQQRALAVWDSLYTNALPVIQPVPTNGEAVQDFIRALAAGFNAGSLAAPTVTSSAATATSTTADLPGNVTSDGGTNILERGIVISVTGDDDNPLLGSGDSTQVTTNGTTGAFTVQVTGLSPGTSYSFKAYASNSVGVGYSAVRTFFTTTPPIVVPQLLAYDSVLNPTNSGMGWSGPWSRTLPLADNLYYPGLKTCGQSAGAGPQVFRNLATGQTTGVVYVAALVTGIGYANVALYDGTTEKVTFGLIYNGSGPGPFYGSFELGQTGTNKVSYSIVATNAATHLILTCFDLDTNTFSLWVDPDLSAPLGAPAYTKTAQAGQSYDFNRVRLEVAGTSRVDEVRLGRSLSDVTGLTFPLTLVCAPDRTLPWVTDSVPVFDEPLAPCPTNVTITYLDSELSANCPAVRSFRRTWTAADDSTNRVSCSQTITFVDTNPPVIVCPMNLVVNPAPGATNARVRFHVTATDNCDTNPAVVCDPDAGAIFSEGTNTVTCTATDTCTNRATCSFTVIVRPESPDLDCLISHWAFDEASGTNALDSAGTNTGRLVNSPLRVPGQFNGALKFNGTSQYVNVPDSDSLDLSNKMSISVWFKPSQLINAASGRKDMLQKFTAYWLIFNYPSGDGKLTFVLNSGANRVKSTRTSWVSNQWYHAVATYDGTNMALYINGVLEGVTPTSVAVARNTFPVQFGGNTQQNFWFPGTLDDVRFYGCAVTTNTVAALFGAMPPPPANTPPVISDSTNRTILKNTFVDVPFIIGDVETAAASLTVSGSSSNTTLVPNANFSFGGTGSNRTVRVTPAGNEIGVVIIALTVSDGTTNATDTFVLTVNDVPAPPPPAPDLIGRWQFDETGGTNALDSAGTNHGRLVNAPTRMPGVLSNALCFNGTSQYVNIPDNNALDVSNRFTMSLWFKPAQLLNAASGRKDLFKKFLAYWLILNYPTGDGKLAFVLNNGVLRVKSVRASWASNQWYHAAATYDGTNMALYINGVLEGTLPATTPAANTANPLQIGGNTEQNYWWPGCLDDARLYSRALNTAEVLALFTEAGTLPAPLPLPGEDAPGIHVALNVDDGFATLMWAAEPGRFYRVQYTDDLGGDNWRDLTDDLLALEDYATAADIVDTATQRFYRVIEQR